MKSRIILSTVLAIGLSLVMFAQTQPAQQPAQTDNIVVLTGPMAENVTANSALVRWDTDQPAETILKYGTDPNNLSQVVQHPFGAKRHFAQIGNLQPGATYYFQVQRPDGSVRASGQFQTLTTDALNNPNQLRITQGPVIEQLGPDMATIAWSTNINTSTVVQYGTGPNNLSQTAQQQWGGTDHRVQITGLQPNTTYYFKVVSGEAQGTGQQVNTSIGQFHTENQGQAPISNKR